MQNESKNYFDPEGFQKETNLKNYRPIMCLLMIWEMAT